MGKLLAQKPYYIRYLNPKFWVAEIKEANRKRWIRVVSLPIIFGGLMFFLSIGVGGVIRNFWGPTMSEENIFVEIESVSFFFLAISIVFLPILEEWIFRGVLLEEISHLSQSKWIGLFSSSLIFALFHLSNPGTYLVAIIPYLVGGLVLGGSYIVGGLSTAVLCHITYNLLLLPFWA